MNIFTVYVAHSGNVTRECWANGRQRAGETMVVWEKARTTYSEEAIASKLNQAYMRGRREMRREVEEAIAAAFKGSTT